VGRKTRYIVALLLSVGILASARADDSSAPTYEKDIKLLFAKRCTVCHRASKRSMLDLSGGLALDSLEGILAGSARDKVIVPGKARDSELVRRLADPDEDRRMPLQDKPLSPEQLEVVRRWIDSGSPRGTSPAPMDKAAAASPRKVRWVRSLDVLLPCDVKLAPGSLDAPEGGTLAVGLRVGPLPAVTALSFRGDGRLLAVGSYGQVLLWDLYDGGPAGAIREIPGPVHALAFSRDGRRLAVGAGLPARSGVARVYAVPDGALIHDFAGHDDVVFALAFRPDGSQLATASFDQTVRFWDLGQGGPAGVFRGHSDFVYSISYSPDGRSLLTAAKDRTVKRLSTRTLKEERTYSEHNEEVLAVAAHPDGKRFLSAGSEPQIRWWGLDADKSQSRRGGHSGAVHQLAFSGDGRWLISSGSDKTVRLWNGMTGALLKELQAVEWQYAAAISDDGKMAAAGGWDGLVRLWDTASGRLCVTLIQPPGVTENAGEAATRPDIDWLAITPGGHVAGSARMIEMLTWRSGEVNLQSAAARAVCERPTMVARAMHGELTGAVKFPSKK
jgi:WD40 repeat protein